MTRITFPYSDMKSLEVQNRNLLGIFSPTTVAGGKSEEELIEEAFLHPIDSDPLQKRVRRCRKVLIVVDDHTRSTPVRKVLPPLMEELAAGGIKKEGVTILIALGTHRPMTVEELAKKLGRDIYEQYPVLNHIYSDKSQLSSLGETEKGTPIVVNRLVEEADFIIGIGQIVPHRVSGFSGGGNIVQPGICGEITTGKTHWLSAQFTGREILGKIENPVKSEIESVAVKTGLKWIFNAIQDGSGKLVHAVAGDPVQAYRVGAARSHEVYRCSMPCEADIVIADSHPFDSDLWVASKGIYASELAVKQGGVVVLVSPCLSGVSVSHPEVLETGYHEFQQIDRLVQNGMIKKLTVAAHLVHVGRVIKEKAQGILVTRGISADECERLGFFCANDPQGALEKALSLCGPDAKVAILQRGSEILPVVQTGNE
ncbi:MAG: nickel-dependent lactate racemase [Desulfomonile tiedjei]|nr:nickel-dependent lactate racemase [Desulfomonile tiedjei]